MRAVPLHFDLRGLSDPTLARKFLSILDCLEAETKDGTTIYLLRDDPEIVCFDGSWWLFASCGIIGVICYCFGIPLIAIARVRRWLRSKLDPDLTKEQRIEQYERVSLLVSSYKDEFWYMEAVWMMHKFYFTGVIHLILPATALQVWAGAFGCVGVFTVTLHLRPYRSYICDWAQLMALLQLLMTYMTMFLFQLDGGSRTPVDDPNLWGWILVLINCVVFMLLTAFLWRGLQREREAAKLRKRSLLHYKRSKEPVELPYVQQSAPGPDAKGMYYHLFLSHVWSTAQGIPTKIEIVNASLTAALLLWYSLSDRHFDTLLRPPLLSCGRPDAHH